MTGETTTLQQERPREGFRFLRHIAVSGIVLCTMLAVGALLPYPYSVPLYAEPVLDIRIGWLPVAGAIGLVASWWIRRRQLRLWSRLLSIGAVLQALCWIWLTIAGRMSPLEAVVAGWMGVILAFCFCARSQRTYECLQGIALCLLILGAWRQVHAYYPQLLMISLVLLVLSSISSRSTVVGVADIYVDTRYPYIGNALLACVFVSVVIAAFGWVIYGRLPRPNEFQRQVLRTIAPVRRDALNGQDVTESRSHSTVPNGYTALGNRMMLTIVDPPPQTGETLFVVQGSRYTRWRKLVLDEYTGHHWRVRKDSSRRMIRTVNDDYGSRVSLRFVDGSWGIGTKNDRLQIHVLVNLGTSLVRPPGTSQAMVPGRQVLRDGVGNVYVDPPLLPTMRYEVQVARTGQDTTRTDGIDDQQYLQLPPLTKRVRQLVRETRESVTSDRQFIMELTNILRQRCRYALVPRDISLGDEATDEFLFESRQGWCVHFASTLAVLCRASEIPARVVVGYGPGVYDPITQTMRIRDVDAHAWIEARPDGGPWEVFDPTPSVDSPLSGEEGVGASSRQLADIRNSLQDRLIGGLQMADRFRQWIAQDPRVFLLVLPAGMVLALLWRFHSTQYERKRVQQLWDDVRDGTPRASTRAAYTLVARHLERHGYGARVNTTPGEYIRRLRKDDSVAASALARIVLAYESTAFGPQVTMRWDRKRLAGNCECVLRAVPKPGRQS